jgi:peptidoglycan-N-acetylglucosamine deacetylase
VVQDRRPIGTPARRLLQVAGTGGRYGFLGLWQRWEPIAMWLWRVRPPAAGSVLQYGVSRYRGPSTVLADGTDVPRGARILHLHLDNRRVTEVLSSAGGNPWAVAPLIRCDLDTIAREIDAGTLGDVKALRGVTVLASMAGRFGFEVRPLDKNLRWTLVRNIAALVIASYHVDAQAGLARGVPWPAEVWMSAPALSRRARGAHT